MFSRNAGHRRQWASKPRGIHHSGREKSRLSFRECPLTTRFQVDVNVKTGVAGDEMFYYDSDYNGFLGLESPAKLKKEEQQPDNSPLYGTFPRDISVTGPQLKNFRILGVINEDDFYYKNKKIR